MVNKYPSVQCPVTQSTCSNCFKHCEKAQRNVERQQEGVLSPSTEMLKGDCWCDRYKMPKDYPHRPTCKQEPKEHRDDEKILNILVKAIAEFHLRCDTAADQAIALMPEPPPPLTREDAKPMVAAGIFMGMKNEFAASIVKTLQDEGFAIGSFK